MKIWRCHHSAARQVKSRFAVSGHQRFCDLCDNEIRCYRKPDADDGQKYTENVLSSRLRFRLFISLALPENRRPVFHRLLIDLQFEVAIITILKTGMFTEQRDTKHTEHHVVQIA